MADERVPDESTADESTPKLELAVPVLGVSDTVRARQYYIEKLGFEVRFEWSDEEADADGTPPQYVIIASGNAEFHLTMAAEPTPSITYVFVKGVDEYYQALRRRDATISQDIRDFPWQMREFEVQDPDGNRLIFGEHLSRSDETPAG